MEQKVLNTLCAVDITAARVTCECMCVWERERVCMCVRECVRARDATQWNQSSLKFVPDWPIPGNLEFIHAYRVRGSFRQNMKVSRIFYNFGKL